MSLKPVVGPVLLSILFIASASAENPFLSSQPGYPKWSAFSGVRWEDEKPLVQIDSGVVPAGRDSRGEDRRDPCTLQGAGLAGEDAI